MPNVTNVRFGTPFYAYAHDAAVGNLNMTETVQRPSETDPDDSESIFAALSAELGL